MLVRLGMVAAVATLAWPAGAEAGRLTVGGGSCPAAQAPPGTTAHQLTRPEVPCVVRVNGSAAEVSRLCSFDRTAGQHYAIEDERCLTAADAAVARASSDCRSHSSWSLSDSDSDFRCDVVVAVGPRTATAYCMRHELVALPDGSMQEGCEVRGAGVHAMRLCETEYTYGQDNIEVCTLAVEHGPSGTRCLLVTEDHHPRYPRGVPLVPLYPTPAIPVVEDPVDTEVKTVDCPPVSG